MTAPTFLALLSVPGALLVLMLESPLREMLLAFNGLAFGLFLLDKLLAGASGARVPELALHLAMCGGPLGGCLGRRLARHKTLHPSFNASAILGLACTAVLATLAA